LQHAPRAQARNEIVVETADRLCEILGTPDFAADLAQAALILATLEYPDLDIARYLRIIDGDADRVAPKLDGLEDPEQLVSALASYLAGECGYQGNSGEYYDPRNSFLNDVIERRTGIPITLSIIYLSLARRAGLPLFGVGLPGHFIVKFDDGTNVLYLDPFHAGRLLDRAGCEQLARSSTGRDFTLSDEHLSAATNHSIMVRMLYNLRGIYSHNLQHRKGLGVADILVRIAPANGYEYRNRAGLHLQLGQGALARADLETYLALRPDAADAEDVKKAIAGIRKSQAMMN
jgi:regulator of sirC expression with transglutaminase-like and TPR domain